MTGADEGLRISLAGDAEALREDLERRLKVPVLASAGLLEIRATPTAALLHRVTGWAMDADVRIVEVAAGSRSLEEVVLALTGRSLR